MKIDKVLGVDVSRDIKERLETIYGITDIETINRVFDCVADEVEPIISDTEESYQQEIDSLTSELKRVTLEIELLTVDCASMEHDEVCSNLVRLWESL